MIKLSIIIPAFNEEKNIKKGVLEEVENYLKDLDYSYEVIIVDDRSTDNTATLVEKFINGKNSWRLIKAGHGGKALTVMKGMLEAKGKIALFTDMDQATPLDQVEKFFPEFEKGNDIVIGSRHGREGAPILRKLTAWGFEVEEVEGEDIEGIMRAIKWVKSSFEKPRAIVLRTVPGKGVSFMEGKYEWHGKAPRGEEAQKALTEIRNRMQMLN